MILLKKWTKILQMNVLKIRTVTVHVMQVTIINYYM